MLWLVSPHHLAYQNPSLHPHHLLSQLLQYILVLYPAYSLVPSPLNCSLHIPAKRIVLEGKPSHSIYLEPFIDSPLFKFLSMAYKGLLWYGPCLSFSPYQTPWQFPVNSRLFLTFLHAFCMLSSWLEYPCLPCLPPLLHSLNYTWITPIPPVRLNSDPTYLPCRRPSVCMLLLCSHKSLGISLSPPIILLILLLSTLH